jgi:hypothetical protein
MADITVGESLNDHELDALFAQVMTCEPALPQADVEGLANLVMKQERVGRPWRLTAVIAGKDGKFYSDLAADAAKAEAMAPTVEILADFSQTLRAIADLADCSAARIQVALSNHADCDRWMEEGAANVAR